jgi:ubiquitin carboxyl-terminal hydrolase 10
MCFANAVLQVFVYTPPFWRLFRELGRYLPQTAEKGGAFDGPVVGREREREREERKDKGRQSEVPLVEATVQFLSEFVPRADKEGAKEKERGRESSRGRKNGWGREASADADEEWVMNSFIPSGVYDVIRSTSRFGGMTVR